MKRKLDLPTLHKSSKRAVAVEHEGVLYIGPGRYESQAGAELAQMMVGKKLGKPATIVWVADNAHADTSRINWLDSEASTDWWANDAAPGEPGTLRETLDEHMQASGAK